MKSDGSKTLKLPFREPLRPSRPPVRAPGLLVSLHTKSNTGYAIEPLEKVFYRVAENVTGDSVRVFFSYRSLAGGWPQTLPSEFRNVAAFDFRTREEKVLAALGNYVRDQRITTIFGFDLPVTLPAYEVVRKNGVRRIISYWGAPMSSTFRPPLLWFRQLDCMLRRYKPDHYIFESEAMRETATRGRGLSHRATSVVRLGVDTNVFKPSAKRSYAHDTFGIPHDRCLVVYSGHMEPRKGVDVIVRAAMFLIDTLGRKDLHFLLLGNKPGEEKRFEQLYQESETREHITFGGYRRDMPSIFGSADIGVIASTGWDSFTMSSVEMASCGLPLIASALQGLKETVVEPETGFLFPPGSATHLADLVCRLADQPELRARMGRAARARIIEQMGVDSQVSQLTHLVQRLSI